MSGYNYKTKFTYLLTFLILTGSILLNIKPNKLIEVVQATETILPQGLNVNALYTFQAYNARGAGTNQNFGIYAMKYYRDELYIGISGCAPSECSAGLLAQYDGSTTLVPIVEDNSGVTHNVYDDDGIHDIDVYNDKMYIVGTDPGNGDGWELGNVYTFTPKEGIIKFRTLPNVVHSLGQTHVGNDWYIANGNIDDAQVNVFSNILVSSDGGNSWTSFGQPSDYRTYDIADLDGTKYALVRNLANSYTDYKLMRNVANTPNDWQSINFGQFIPYSRPHPFARLTRLEDKIIGITSSNGIFSIKNSSANATLHTLPGGRLPVQQYNPIAVDNDGYVYIITTNKEVIRTKNLYTWELVANIPATGSLAALTYNDNTNVLAVSSIGTDANVWLLNLNEIQSLPVIGTDPYLTKISGISYLDQDKDGQYDSGETKLENVAMNLKSLSGELLETTQTDINGYYEFVYMPVTNDLNNYYVEQVQPDGLVSIQIPTNRFDFSINAYNTSIPNVNFGESIPANISGRVYREDRNPLEGISDVEVLLMDGENQLATSSTDKNGYYNFDSIVPDQYTILERQPSTYFDGSINSTNSITVDHQSTDTANQNFSERKGSIYGRVYLDLNKNNQLDLNESGIANVNLNLYNQKDLIQEYLTDENGSFEFSELSPSTYLLEEIQPTGFISTQNGNGIEVELYTDSDQYIPFGESNVLPSLSGYVYIDKNNNGQKDNNEVGIPKVEIVLEGTYRVGISGPTIYYTEKAYTDKNGFYIFYNVRKGQYSLREIQPGYIDGKDTIGSLGGITVNDQHYDIQVTAYNGENYLFGEINNKISGIVYNQNTNEPIRDVLLELRTESGEVLGITTTNESGYYEFDEMPAGNYLVVQTQPKGYYNGDINPTNKVSINYELYDVEVNFSEVKGLADTGRSINWFKLLEGY
ncbi:hypothetical protein IPJ91_00845 [bacterium]|nr:MAG: hypothetical protein IPJ91_00845 [bacterium]